MNEQEAQTLQLNEMVVWTPDGMKGEVIVKDGCGVRIRWEDGSLAIINLPTCCLKSKGYRVPRIDARLPNGWQHDGRDNRPQIAHKTQLYAVLAGLNEIWSIARQDYVSLEAGGCRSGEFDEIEARMAMANRINQQYGTNFDWREYDFVDLFLLDQKLRGKSQTAGK